MPVQALLYLLFYAAAQLRGYEGLVGNIIKLSLRGAIFW